MKTILVSGASGVVGYGILRSLRMSGKPLKLVGTTIYTDSVAQGFCDTFEQAPPSNDPGYIDWLGRIIRKHRVDMVIPGIEADMYLWAGHAADIASTGTIPLLNDTGLISLCRDKWLFHQKQSELRSPYLIPSSISADHDELTASLGSPFIVKPRSGYGSKGVAAVDSREAFSAYRDAMGAALMAQTLVGNEDEEYTTSAFCDGTGGYFAFMTLRRKLSAGGFTEKAEVADVPEAASLLDYYCSAFKPAGPTNFQYRTGSDGLKLLEINPRISSSTSIRAGFGYNETAMSIEYYLEGKPPVQPVIRRGRAVRYIEDFFFYEDRTDI